MNEEIEAKVLKESVNEILNRLAITSKWKDITCQVIDFFIKNRLIDDNNNAFDRLRDNIRKTLTDDNRKNIKLLRNLKDALEEKDHITILCNNYLSKFRTNMFFIPENDLKELKDKADNGHLLCQRTLGEHYQGGGNLGIPNIIESHRYYTQSFEQYDWLSALYLANIYSKFPLYNEDIAFKYYEYAILFYFEGKDVDNFIRSEGVWKISDYIKSRWEVLREELIDLVNKFDEYEIGKINNLTQEEKVDYLLKKMDSLESKIFLMKIYESFKNVSGIGIAFRFLSGYYKYSKDDKSFFLISLVGSLCGDLSLLSNLAFAFQYGKGVNKTLELSAFCYALLYIVEKDEKWMKPLNDIYVEIQSTGENNTNLAFLDQLISSLSIK